MIRAAFFDVDGTIVPFNTHRMTDVMLDTLHALQRSGVKVVVASGRPWYCIDNVRDFPFDAWISCNGALATVGGETVYSCPVRREDVVKVAQIATERGIPTFAFGRERGGVNCMNEQSDEIQSLIGLPMPPFRDIVQMAMEEPVYELTSYVSPELERELFHPALAEVEYIRWHPYFTDINPKGLSKAFAVLKVLDYYGIAPEEAIAFGDGGNDIAMLECCGIGVALGNASDEVKSHADLVTLSVDEDGVTAALKQLGVL